VEDIPARQEEEEWCAILRGANPSKPMDLMCTLLKDSTLQIHNTSSDAMAKQSGKRGEEKETQCCTTLSVLTEEKRSLSLLDLE
jgi:hypothetical protein